MEEKLDKLALTGETKAFLISAGINTIQLLESLSQEELKALPFIGPMRVDEILDALDKYRAGDFKHIPKKLVRSLYQCGNARVMDDHIYCKKTHSLGTNAGKNGTIDIRAVAKGRPLQVRACQFCTDFDEMGSDLPAEERGWIPKN